MPIPPFNIHGVIPPFIGPHGPGGAAEHLTPYLAKATEVVATLGGSQIRRDILRGWLQHRQSLRRIGLVQGFQWLDGSFVENKVPKDLDVVTFIRRPQAANTPQLVSALMRANPGVFDRNTVKAAHFLDAFFIDMDGNRETVVDLTRYWLGLFSHCRGTAMWKGMLQVRLEDTLDDAAAVAALDAAQAAADAAQAAADAAQPAADATQPGGDAAPPAAEAQVEIEAGAMGQNP